MAQVKECVDKVHGVLAFSIVEGAMVLHLSRSIETELLLVLHGLCGACEDVHVLDWTSFVVSASCLGFLHRSLDVLS